MDFVKLTKPDYDANWHHKALCGYIQKFVEGKIKKMIVCMPPQHGKSELTSRRLPAYLLGKNPTLKLVGCSYSADLAKAFNRDVQRIIDDEAYAPIFPQTKLNSSNIKTSAKGSYLRNADIFEVVNHRGFYKSVGVGGSLTGTPVDIGIIDDPIKDKVEAESPTFRARVWDWYVNVFLTRMHNDSQQLITLTRWHRDDLAGRILAKMNKDNDWVVVKIPAIKEKPTIIEDQRRIGEALWPRKHSLKRILEIKAASPLTFASLYQQDPEIDAALKIYPEWQTCSDAYYEAITNYEYSIFYGVDFGFTNPTALIQMKLVGKKLYIREVVYNSGLTNKALIDLSKDRNVSIYDPIGADSNKPDAIVEMRSAHFNIRKVSKGPGSVFNGIKKVKEYDLVVCEGSKNVQKELETYKWKEDVDSNPLPVPIKKDDHAMDAIRYGLKNFLLYQKRTILSYG